MRVPFSCADDSQIKRRRAADKQTYKGLDEEHRGHEKKKERVNAKCEAGKGNAVIGKIKMGENIKQNKQKETD